MEITFDEKAIQNAVQDSTNSAVTKALSGYDVQKLIGELVTNEVATGAIGEAIKKAASQINHEALVKAIAIELDRAVASAVVTVIRDAMIGIIAKIRGVSEYGSAERADALNKIRAELKM